MKNIPILFLCRKYSKLKVMYLNKIGRTVVRTSRGMGILNGRHYYNLESG
jgi:hypothetical protein